jgi:hypothetical protein
MKRGLVILDRTETPPDLFQDRLNSIRRQIKAQGADLAFMYADVSRSGDLNYLTNFCLYWNEAVLAVPVEGPPVLLMKLSKRVQPWIRRTSILEDIRSTQRLAEGISALVSEYVRGRPPVVALVDMQWWPNNLVAQLRSSLPQAVLHDLPRAVRDLRLVPSAEELRFLQQGAELLHGALLAAWAQEVDAHGRNSIAVRNLRLAGFLDATVTCGKLEDGSEFADAAGQYRHVWLRQSRPRGGPLAEAARRALGVVLSAARTGTTETDLRELATRAVGIRYKASFSCMPHTDIETQGAFRTSDDSRRPLKKDEIVCVALSLSSSAGFVTAAETVQVTRNGAAALFKENA